MTNLTGPAALRNVNLLVSDVDRSRRFYAEVFGLAVDTRRSAPPAMLILSAPGACTLSLKDRATEEPHKLAGSGDVELGFETNDVDGCHAAASAFGVTVGEVRELGFGRTFDLLDPDGHHLVVYALTERG
ncbi:VOC family protein [Deinococcus pimensis]|uniref:VOC family protein n=1 Tax=Deinococcus pimensis TaxID=309888 RepID=UPI0004817770|nr:VOC family protein [Deinococcus pimensis]